MGTEAAWVPMVIAAVGAGASYYNTQQTAKRQDNALADQIRAQGQRQREADSLVQDAILQQQGSTPDEARKASLDQYLGQLQRTQGDATAGLGQIGAVSDRFGQDAAGAAGDIAATGQRTADIMSRIDAPLLQRQNEGISFGRLGSELGRVGMLSESDRYLGDIRMRGIRRNPWIDAAAAGAQGYAGAMGGAGSSAPTGATGSTAFGYGSF